MASPASDIPTCQRLGMEEPCRTWNCSSGARRMQAGCQGAASGKDLLPRGLWHQKLLCQGSGWRNTEDHHVGMVKVNVIPFSKRKFFISLGDISALCTSRDHPWAVGAETAGATRKIHYFPKKTHNLCCWFQAVTCAGLHEHIVLPDEWWKRYKQCLEEAWTKLEGHTKLLAWQRKEGQKHHPEKGVSFQPSSSRPGRKLKTLYSAIW